MYRTLSSLLLCVALLVAGSSCRNAPTANPADRAARAATSPLEAIRADVTYLASDELDGRGVGTAGLDKAADFIAQRFASLGLEPVPGFDGFFQPFEMRAGSAIGADTALRVNGSPLVLDEQFRPLAWSASAEFAGPVVFAGYSINAEDRNYNDFAGVDVKDKVVLAMRYEPHEPDGSSRFVERGSSRHSVLTDKVRRAADAGATAIILVNPPMHRGDDDALLPFSGAGAGRSAIPVLTVTRAIADAWLAQAGQPDLRTLQEKIDTAVAPQSVELAGVSVSGAVSIEPRRAAVRNVLAMLPARDADGTEEIVVIGAHYDHLGMGGQGSMSPSVTAIHHGADDNASGTAALLQVAERLARTGPRERTIVFIAFTAEERGLIGSARFVNQGGLDLSRVVAMINLDMVGRVRNQMLYVGGGGTARSFQPILDAADQRSPLTLKSMGRGGTGPSDHASFSQKRIPVLFFFSGLHEDYHRPSDTSEKINYDGIAKVVEVTVEVLGAIAAGPREAYVDRYDAEGVNVNIAQQPIRPTTGRATSGHATTGPTTVSSDTAPPARRVRFGVVPDFTSADATDGVVITGTSPGSPAEAAGLKSGDKVVQIGEMTIQNLMDMQEALSRLEAGQKVSVTLLRDGQRVELPVTMTVPEGSR
jgi:hypothetical protein